MSQHEQEFDDDGKESESKEKSVFDIRKERLRSNDQVPFVSQCLLLSKIQLADREDVYDYLERTTKKFLPQVSGFVLIFPTYVVTLCEGPADMVSKLLKRLQDDEAKASMKTKVTRILVFSYNACERMFQNWYYHLVDIMPVEKIDQEAAEQPVRAVQECLAQLLKLFDYLRNVPKPSLKAELESLYDKVPHFVPPQDVMNFLAATNHPCLTPLQEHMNWLYRPFHTILESELVWPMSNKIFPIL